MGLFRGWWMVAASGIGLSTNPGQFAYGALGVFMLPLTAEFGWSRTDVSLSLTVFTIALACALPLLGRCVDRHGGRRVLIPSVTAFGLLLLAVGLMVSKLWHLWLLFLLMGSLAAGANAMPYFRILAAWFDRRRGLAFGLAMAGGGFGYMYVAPLLQWLIDGPGWRTGYLVLGSLVLVLALPIALFVLRDSPRESGLWPDGDPGPSADNEAAAVSGSVDTATGRRVFVILIGVFAVLSLCLYGLLANLVPLLVDRGMAARDAAWMAALLGMSILVSRGVVGYLIDRWLATRVAAVCILLSAAGMGLFLSGAASGAPAMAATCLVGLTIGAEIDLLAFLVSRYFGMVRFGRAYAILFIAFLLGTAAGPPVYAALFDTLGNYDVALGGAAVLLSACAAAMLALPDYRSAHA